MEYKKHSTKPINANEVHPPLALHKTETHLSRTISSRYHKSHPNKPHHFAFIKKKTKGTHKKPSRETKLHKENWKSPQPNPPSSKNSFVPLVINIAFPFEHTPLFRIKCIPTSCTG